ncbi:MAG: hypothetical protein AAF662_15825, partial [Pseudomonadota bacterium]
FQIEADLDSVLPEQIFPVSIDSALDEIKSTFQRRITIVLVSRSGDPVQKEQALDAASIRLRNQLASIPNVSLLPGGEDLLAALVDGLIPYRFQLLSRSERARLISDTDIEVLDQAERRLYRVGSPTMLPFVQDPFGVHQQTLFDLVSENSGSLASDDASDFRVISLMLGDEALRIGDQERLLEGIDQALRAAVISADTNDHPFAAPSIDTQPEIVSYRSGVFFYSVDAAVRSKNEVLAISTVSSIAVLGVLFFVFRSTSAIALALGSMAFGILAGVLASHAVFGQIHVFTIVFGVGLIGVVIDYSLHFLFHSADVERGRLRSALVLSALTSIIGYGALFLSSLAVLKAVAVFAVAGIAMALLTVVSLGPLLAPIQPHFLSLPNTIVRPLNRKIALALAGFLLVIAGVMITTILIADPFDDRPEIFFKAPAALLESDKQAASYTGDLEPGRFITFTGTTSNEVYDLYRSTTQILKAESGLARGQFVSILDWVPDTEEQRSNYEQQRRLYGGSGLLGNLFSRLGLSGQDTQLRTAFANASELILEPDTVQTLLGAALPVSWLRTDNNITALAFLRKGTDVEALDEPSWQVGGVNYINLTKRTQAALRAQRESAGWILLVSMAITALLLAAAFRDIRAALLAFVPAFSCLASLALLSLLGTGINLFHTMACFLVLGFGLDYVIFVRQMTWHVPSMDLDEPAPNQTTSATDTHSFNGGSPTLRAITLSFVTSQLSFGLLALSSISIVQAFGVTLFIGNTVNLMGAVLVRALAPMPLLKPSPR